jgi:hypothetical protein
MKSLKLGRYALSSCVATAILAGCGGSQPPIGVPGAIPQSPAIATRADHGGSWMGLHLRQRDLLYVVSNSRVDVYRYWQRKHVGVLTDFSEPVGACADSAGNVYIVDYSRQKIYEYAHGGKTPIKTLDDSPYAPSACSVTPSTGDLAVANSGYPYYKSGNLAIYRNGTGKPIFLHGSGLHGDEFVGCTYDDRDDLLAMTQYNVSSVRHYEFYYRANKGKKLRLILLPNIGQNSIQGLTWDGKYWVVGPTGDQLDSYSIGSRARYVGTVTLPQGYLSGSIAIYRKNFVSRGTQVVEGVNDYYPEYSVLYWEYPAGGDPMGSFVDFSVALAISLGKR